MSKRVVFKISNDGNVAIDSVEGYGSSCLDFTSLLEQSLGKVDELSRKFTEEYNEPIAAEGAQHIQH
jgi:hypothetical protein